MNLNQTCNHESKTKGAYFEKFPMVYEAWRSMSQPGNLLAIETRCDKCGYQWVDYPDKHRNYRFIN